MKTTRVRLKVCCISSVEEARLAVHYGADALGLVGPMATGPGVLPLDVVRGIVPHVPAPVATFLLTSQTTAEGIAADVLGVGANTVQIVSHVDPAIYPDLRRRLGPVKIVQVIHVEDRTSLILARDYARVADTLLLDSGKPACGELGGTGRVHDWAISAEIVARTDRPVFLAGGLNPDNIRAAVEAVRPYGVDLCSGLRTGGRLDEAKLARFVAALWPGHDLPERQLRRA